MRIPVSIGENVGQAFSQLELILARTATATIGTDINISEKRKEKKKYACPQGKHPNMAENDMIAVREELFSVHQYKLILSNLFKQKNLTFKMRNRYNFLS